MIKLWCTCFLFSFCFASSLKAQVDSLYRAKEYAAFLDASTLLLEQQPQLKRSFPFLLKLANASFQEERYALSRQIYGLAAAKDSILIDYVRYFNALASLQLADTLKFYEQTEQFYTSTPKNYLALDLLRSAVNLTSEQNDTVHFLRFADLYSQERKLRSATAFKRLEVLQKVASPEEVLNEQVAFLKSYASSDYAEVVIDSIYENRDLGNLESDEMYHLFRAAVQNDYRHDSLIHYYDRVEEHDETSELMLDYLLTEKQQSAAIDFIKKEKRENNKVSKKLARFLPRLLNKKRKTKEAYAHYLDYARLYPNHPFALNAVTFVMGRTEKKDTPFFRKVMREFTQNESKYKQYYRFRHVLHYYEKKDFKTAMRLINTYLKGKGLSSYHRMRLSFWKAKLHFELNNRPAGFAMLERLAKTPFNSYYNMKSYISLIENERDSLLPKFGRVRHASLQPNPIYWENYRRLELVSEIYGSWFEREERRRTKFIRENEGDYHTLIEYYKDKKLFSQAFRTAIRYRSLVKNKELLDSKSDIQNFAFPEFYREPVVRAAEKYKLDSALVWGVIYRESAFQHDARSAANAHGLMQLLPSTGKQTAKRLKLPYSSYHSLYNSNLNIELGTYHLSKLLERFDGKIELALAAYNAGASRVVKWKKQNSVGNMDLFIEKIPFEQTRTYVKKIIFVYYAYRILDQRSKGAYYSGIKARS